MQSVVIFFSVERGLKHRATFEGIRLLHDETPRKSTPVAAGDVVAAAIHVTVMPQLLRSSDNRNAPLVEPGKGALALSYFNLLRLRSGTESSCNRNHNQTRLRDL